MNVVLRPYQERGLAALREALRLGARDVLLVSPTGSGKGTVNAHLLASASHRSRRALFLVHRKELVRDIATRLLREGVTSLGVIQAGESRGDPSGAAQVCSVATLTARPHMLPDDVALIVIDEAHHATAKTYRAIRARYPKAMLVGTTATPVRSDTTALGDVFRHLIVMAQPSELLADGHLVPWQVFAPARLQPALSMTPLAAYQHYTPAARAIVFAANVPHARETAAAFVAAGIPAACVTAETPRTERDLMVARFARGDVLVLTNVGVLTEGFDVPAIQTVVLARPCGSTGLFLQMTGRAGRIHPPSGKTHATLIDLFGAVHQHGLPDEDRAFSLDGKAISDAAALPPLRTCAPCGATFRPRDTCPRCGAPTPEPPMPKTRLAELKENPDIASQEEKQVFFNKLYRERDLRHYQWGWLHARFQARFGHPAKGFRYTGPRPILPASYPRLAPSAKAAS